jgi:predicted nucleotidyltransferase component of viral defense system
MSSRAFPDRHYFTRLARESGFRAEPLETVFRLVDLLNRITQQLGPELLLRGGTALNLIYLDVPRLSVDVDLDFIGTANSTEAQARRPQLLRETEELLSRAGYEVRSERPSYAMSHHRFHYTNVLGLPRFLKVDINFLDRVPVLLPETRELSHPFGEDLPAVALQTFALSELAASKLIALVRRAAARDLFDVAMVSQVGSFDDQMLKTLMVVRGASYPPPGPDAYNLSAADAVKPTIWKSEVMALARRPLPINLRQAKERAGEMLRTAAELEEGHLAFLRNLEEEEIRPDALQLPNPSRVSSNPGLLWRLKAGVQALEER